jgi:hypothetical protein
MRQEDFIGRWTLSRKVFDRERRLIGGMWGRVLFEKVADTELIYRESVWNISGESSQFLARQTYLYRFKEKEIEIYLTGKEEDVPFLTLPHGKTVVDGHYLCKPDLYALRWVWVNSHLFYTRFSVKGVRKDHTLETVFRR